MSKSSPAIYFGTHTTLIGAILLPLNKIVVKGKPLRLAALARHEVMLCQVFVELRYKCLANADALFVDGVVKW